MTSWVATVARFSAGAGLLLLSACATVVPLPRGQGAAAEQLAALSHWRLDGRIAVQSPSDAFQAGLSWEHEGRQDRVQVSGPLSQGAYSIVLQDDLILIRDNKGNVRSSRNGAALLRDELGVAVPLAGLRYWVLGLGDPSTTPAERFYDQEGRLRQLSQNGWKLDYLAYTPVGDLVLPQKISARSRDLKLKLFVDDWSILH